MLLVGLNGDEQLPTRDDLGSGALLLRRGPGAGGEPVVELLDEVGHPAAEALEHADAELGEEVENAAANE